MDKNNKNSILTDASSNNERNLNSEIFATYLSRLDKKYKGDVRSIETDNIRDIFQIEQKSEIKKDIQVWFLPNVLAIKTMVDLSK